MCHHALRNATRVKRFMFECVFVLCILKRCSFNMNFLDVRVKSYWKDFDFRRMCIVLEIKPRRA